MGGVRLQGEISGSARPIYSKDEAQEWRKTGMLHLCASFETSDSPLVMLPLPSCPTWWADSECSRLLDTEAALWVKYLRYLLWLGNARSSQRQASMQIG
jgi:hypothetical protein